MGGSAAPAGQRLNVLFIASDDLRTELGCYGHPEIISPHLDALARRGVLFERAYCQQSVCNPSRASLMTGLRPDTLQVWTLGVMFRETHPDAVTLPQYFKANGYFAQGIGKIFHNDSRPVTAKFRFSDPASWSIPPTHADGDHWQDWVVPGHPEGPTKKQGPVQALDVPDNAYFDGKIADDAVTALRGFKEQGTPFFLAVGFWKPHLPFNAPKKYWDLYDRTKIALPDPAEMPKDAPEVAHHDSYELRNYAGMPKTGVVPSATALELRHGYFAAISFMDAQVGRVLDELDRLGLADNTIVVFWGDNGFHLGEHDLWGKTSNYELDTHIPLIIAPPRSKAAGAHTRSLVELLDLYPTLVELAGLPAAPGLEGRSLAPILRDPETKVHDFVLSQHQQPFYGKAPAAMGRAVRTDEYRYVEWRDVHTHAITARELYDERADPKETVNRAADPSLASVVAALSAKIPPAPAFSTP